MAIAEDLTLLECRLGDLIARYEQYFIGLEKREPLQLLNEVEVLVRRYTGMTINNTMYKHKFAMLVARLNTYRERWNRNLRLMEEGKFSRDCFIRDLHQRRHGPAIPSCDDIARRPCDNELERVYHEFREARKACNLPVDKLSRDLVAAAIERKKPALTARLGSDDLTFRVVVENGKPKIKASLRK